MYGLSKVVNILKNCMQFSFRGVRMNHSLLSSVDLATMNKSEMKDFMSSFDTVLTDCDGVVWLNGKAIPGAVEVMNKFKEIGKKVFYVTNNSTHTRPEFLDKCTRLGFNATEFRRLDSTFSDRLDEACSGIYPSVYWPVWIDGVTEVAVHPPKPVYKYQQRCRRRRKHDDIICTAWLTSLYFQRIGFNKKVYVIGSKAIVKELKNVGIESFGIGPDLVNPNKVKTNMVMEELAPADDGVGAVVVGYDHHFSLPKIVKACTYLSDPDCLFIGTNTDQTYPHSGKFVWPGTGAFIAAIETSSQRKAKVLGKPESFIIDAVLKGCGMDPKRTLMLGDRCNTDIFFGTRVDMITILVLSGVTTMDNLKEFEATGQHHLVPTFYSNSIADLVPFFNKDMK